MASPSFKNYQPASELSSRVKRLTKRTDTKPEVLLRTALWRRGLRYRKNVRSIRGKPDLVFLRARVAVFCDGDFWHGRDWPSLREKLHTRANSDYWIAKIQANIERDQRTTESLTSDGWLVMRIWESDIARDPTRVAEEVHQIVRARVERAGP